MESLLELIVDCILRLGREVMLRIPLVSKEESHGALRLPGVTRFRAPVDGRTEGGLRIKRASTCMTIGKRK